MEKPSSTDNAPLLGSGARKRLRRGIASLMIPIHSVIRAVASPTGGGDYARGDSRHTVMVWAVTGSTDVTLSAKDIANLGSSAAAGVVTGAWSS